MPRKPANPKKTRATAKSPAAAIDVLGLFHPTTAQWFREALGEPTAPQVEGWPAVSRGESTLILAPTGTGKTLAAFLWCLDKLMLQTPLDPERGSRVVYVSPLKALAVDVGSDAVDQDGAIHRRHRPTARNRDAVAQCGVLAPDAAERHGACP